MGALFGASGKPPGGASPAPSVLGDVKYHLASWTPPAPKATPQPSTPNLPGKGYSQEQADYVLGQTQAMLGRPSGVAPVPEMKEPTNYVFGGDLWGRLAQHASNLVNEFLPGLSQLNTVGEQLTGVRDAKSKIIDVAEQTGKMTHEQANAERAKLLQAGEFAGKKDEQTGQINYNLSPDENAIKAAGVAGTATSEMMLKPAFTAAKGAPLLNKIGAGALSGALVGGIHATGANLVKEGKLNAGETAQGAAVGAGFGAGAEVLAKGAGKVASVLFGKKGAPVPGETAPAASAKAAPTTDNTPAFIRRAGQPAPELPPVKPGNVEVPAYQRRGLVLQGAAPETPKLTPEQEIENYRQKGIDYVPASTKTQIKAAEPASTESTVTNFGERFKALTPAQKGYYKNKLAFLRNKGAEYADARDQALVRAENMGKPAATSAAETVGKAPETTFKVELPQGQQLPATSRLERPGENMSSRVKQYEQHLQESIAGIEKSPTYEAELKAKGGNLIIGNKQVYEQARKAGPLSDEAITNAKPLDKIDTVTLVRAKATLNQAAEEFTDAWKSGKLNDDQLGSMADRLAKLEAGYKVMSAEPGRATQVQSSFIDDAYKVQQKLADLQRTVKGPNKRQLIQDELDSYQKELQNKGINKSTARKWMDMLTEYATSAKLTSPLTHFVNIASNLLTLPQKAMEDLVKIGLNPKTGLGQAKYVFGTKEGLVNASKQFAADLKATAKLKAVPDVMGKVEQEGAIPGKIGEAVRTPFKLLSAADNFFKNLLRDRELNQSAYSQAWQEGHRGAALKQRTQELVKAPTEDMLNRAQHVSEEFTFTNDPGHIANGIIDIMGKVPLLRLLVPFVKTPTNIAQFQLRRSALGVFSPQNIKDIMKGGVSRQDAIARLAVGTGLSAAGIIAVTQGGDNVTGAAPTDPGQKDAFYAAGKKPYAIKIGDTWVQYNRFQPVGMYLTQAVGLRDALMNGNSKTAGNIFTSMAATTAKGMADLPYVSGISSVVDALNNPNQLSTANKVISGIIGGLIPNLSRDIATATDTTQRNPKTITEQLKMSVPGLRQQVQPRTDLFGTTQPASSQDPFMRGFVKITSKDRPNELLDALKEANNFTPSPPPQQQRGQALDQITYSRFQTRSGQLFAEKIKQALTDPDYQGLDPERKQKTLQAALSDARTQALDEILGKQQKTPQLKVRHYR